MRAVTAMHAAPPMAFAGLARSLARSLSGYSAGGHAISLALAGALLDTVPPESVPAIVDAATAAAGWRAPSPGHYRRNAEDTVR
ncbi:MAG: hypothetical protein WC700_10220, partial [Gemmatimonadaceae bacterium]